MSKIPGMANKWDRHLRFMRVVSLESQITKKFKEMVMPTVIISGKLEKSYDHWVSAFDGHDDVRKASGLKVLYRGHDLSDASAIHIVLQTPSMEVLGEFMKENAEYMKESGHIPNSGERTVCSDM